MHSRVKILRLLVSIATILIATVAALSAQEENKILVASIIGNWKYENDKNRVKFGQALPAEGCLYGSEGSVVLALDKKNGPLQPFPCEKPSRDSDCTGNKNDRCAVPLNPHKWKATGSGLGNVLDAFRQLFRGDSEKYMVAASRGIEPGLVDAVLPLQDHNLDVAPAFREMPGGQYWIKLSPVNEPSIANNVLEVRFTPHSPAVARASSLQPGLYRLSLVEKSGAPAGSDSWVLITSAENYSSASDLFQRATADSEKWPEEMDPSATRALLRAYLESLSTSSAKSKP
jgi:hypothetical protein